MLKPGAAADVIIMDYKPFTPFSHENVDGHMLFGMEGKNCRTTIINGKVLYKDREFVGIDEDKINAFAWSSPRSCGANSTTELINSPALILSSPSVLPPAKP